MNPDELNELKKEASRVWVKYGETICEFFGFEGNIIAEPLLETLRSDSEDSIRSFIQYVKEQISFLKNR